MSKIKIQGSASGTGVLTIAAPNTNTDRTITIPDVTGTLLDSGSDLPAANLTGTIADARLSSGITSAKLPLAGGTMTGDLTVEKSAPYINISNSAENIGGIKMYDNGGASTQYFNLTYDSGSSNEVGFDTGASGEYTFSVNTAEKMRIDSSGNVGIDNTAPIAKLHIGSHSENNMSVQSLYVSGAKTGYASIPGLPQNQLMIVDTTTSTLGSGGAIGFGAITGSSQNTWIASINSERISATNDASNYGGNLVFYTRPAQSTPAARMIIQHDGNVGIGETTPEFPLEIGITSATSQQVGFEITQATSGNECRMRFKNTANGQYVRTGIDSGGTWYVEPYNSSGYIKKLNVTTGGYVTMPQQPSFCGGRAAGGTVTNAVFIMSDVQHNVGNHYNTSTGIFTCPVSGIYEIGFSVMASSPSGTQDAFTIKLNSTNKHNHYQTAYSGSYQRVDGNARISCSANDSLSFQARSWAIYAGSSTHSYGYIRLLG